MKAIVLLSGGLDSTLAAQLMLDQGIDVLAVNFVSPFCTCDSRKEGSCHMAAAVAARMGVRLRVVSKGLDYLKMIEHPRFGYGRGMNACLDCRIYMLRKAAEFMEAEGVQFIVTGEVLGQRPMSQHRAALETIERESGLTDRILRPLSAQWLNPSLPERNGWVDRSRLLAIRGRSRTGQLALAKQEGVDLFGCPSGGCLLTDPIVARRLRDLFRYGPDDDMRDAMLLALGRHFRLHPGLKMILGRDQAENDKLQRIGAGGPRLELADIPGPLMLIRGTFCDGAKRPLVWLLRHFAPKATTASVTARWAFGERHEFWTFDGRVTDAELDAWKI